MAGEIEVGRAAVRIFADDSQFWRDIRRMSSANVEDIRVKATADTTAANREIENLKRNSASADDTIDVDVDQRGIRSINTARTSVAELGDTIRGLGEIAGVLKMPAMLAGIAALPSLALSATVQIGQLALGIGQGLAGAFAVAGTAALAARGGIAAYIGIAKSLVEEAQEIKTATDAQGLSLREVRQQYDAGIYQSVLFASKLEDLKTQFERLEKAVAVDTMKTFNGVLDLVTDNFDIARDAAKNLTAQVNFQIRSFTRLASRARSLRDLRNTLIQVGTITGEAAKIAKNLFFVFLAGLRPVLPMSVKLSQTLGRLSTQMRRWAESTRGQRQIAEFFRNAWARAQQLYRIIVNLGRGFRNLFQIISPGTRSLFKDIERLSQSFSRVGARGTESRQKIKEFVAASRPIMRALWRLVGEVAKQFVILANNVAKARNGNRHVRTLVGLLNDIRKALPDVRKLLEQTFKDLAPELGPLIRQVARFFRVFAGSTDVLERTVRLMTRMLRAFNRLPAPVKDVVAELIAFRIISRLLGLNILVALAASLGKVAAKLWATSRGGGAAAGALGRVGKNARNAGGGATILGRGLGRIVWPVAAALAFAAAMRVLYRRNADFRRGFDQSRKSLGATRESTNKAQGAMEEFGEAMSALAGGKGGGIIGALKRDLTDEDGLSGVFKDLARKAGIFGNQTGHNFVSGIKKTMAGDDAGIKKWSENYKRKANSHFGIRSPSTFFANIGKMNVAGLSQGMNKNAPQAAKASAGVRDKVAAPHKNLNLQPVGLSIIRKLASGVSSGAGSAATAAGNVATRLRNAFNGINLYAVGANIVRGLINGVGALAQSVYNKGVQIAQQFINGVKDRLGIKSPSRVMHQFGRNTMEGYALGIESMSGRVRTAFDRVSVHARGAAFDPFSLFDTSRIKVARSRGGIWSYGGSVNYGDFNMPMNVQINEQADIMAARAAAHRAVDERFADLSRLAGRRSGAFGGAW